MTGWSRREILSAAAGATAAALGRRRTAAAGRMPALFLAHGAPPLLDDAKWVGELHAWAGALPRPKAILMLSAHWEARPVTIGATRTLPLIHDFSGFAPHHYEQLYPAPGAPELARRVRAVGGSAVAHFDQRKPSREYIGDESPRPAGLLGSHLASNFQM